MIVFIISTFASWGFNAHDFNLASPSLFSSFSKTNWVCIYLLWLSKLRWHFEKLIFQIIHFIFAKVDLIYNITIFALIGRSFVILFYLYEIIPTLYPLTIISSHLFSLALTCWCPLTWLLSSSISIGSFFLLFTSNIGCLLYTSPSPRD